MVETLSSKSWLPDKSREEVGGGNSSEGELSKKDPELGEPALNTETDEVVYGRVWHKCPFPFVFVLR